MDTVSPRTSALTLGLLAGLTAGAPLDAQQTAATRVALPPTPSQAPPAVPATLRPVAPQPLTLAAALALADSDAFANRQAEGRVAARSAEAWLATSGLLPALRTEVAAVRTTDPLAAFGARLRQRAVTPAAFDPDRLNDPDAIGNVGAAVIAEVPLLVPSAWQDRRAARAALASGVAEQRWTRTEVRVAVVRDYTSAQLATAGIAVVTAALETARGQERDAEAAVRQGVATRSDLLLAAVRRGTIATQQAEATAAAALAHDALAARLGQTPNARWCLAEPMPSADALRAVALAERSVVPDSTVVADATDRPDVQAARLGAAAASEAARGARAALLPRLAAFGRLDWNTPRAAFAGQSAWTIGLLASWSPFSGGRELGGIRLADARRQTADVQLAAARAAATVEYRDALRQLEVAITRLETAGSAVAQAAEAERIVLRKYRGGLATIVETLDASAVAVRVRLQELQARHALLLAIAEWRRVRGLDPAPPLESPSSTGASC